MTKAKAKFTKDEEAIIAGFNEVQLADFNGLELEMQHKILKARIVTAVDAANIEASGDVEFEGTGLELEDGTFLTMSPDKANTIPSGTVITALFHGMGVMWSETEKENWTKVLSADKQTVKYRSTFFKFKNTKNEAIMIFDNPMLRNELRSLLTNEATPHLVGKNPLVKMIFGGQVTKEVAKQEYGFIVSTGNKVNAVKVLVEKGALRDSSAGFKSYLSSPIPTATGGLDELTAGERELLAYNNQVLANNTARVAAEGVKQLN